MSECIDYLRDPTIIKEQPTKRHVSKHPGNLPPSYSTFNTKMTNVTQNNIAGNQVLHRGYFKHHALWGKPKFDTQDEFPFPVGLVMPDKIQMTKPSVPPHYKYKADPQKFKEFLMNKPPKRPQTAPKKEVQYRQKEGFGKVPEYLEKMNQARFDKLMEEENEMRARKEERERNRPKQSDIYKLLQELEKKKEQLMLNLGQYTHKRQMTEQTKQKKEELERQVKQVEDDMKKLSRYVFK